jgi:glucokinase
LAKLKERLPIPMKITNDANAAAVGEMLFGSAKGMQDFIVVTLGTGFGSGIVANGQLINGYDGFAGELGHVDMTLGDGRLTGQGVRGGLEAYVSATGLKRTIMHMQAKYMDESRFRNIAFNDLHGEDITQAAEEGDPIALKAFDFTARVLGLAMANFTAFSQPEAFILMGGLVNSGKWILDPLYEYFEDNLLQVYKGKVKILLSGLPSKTAAIAGAAALIWADHTDEF